MTFNTALYYNDVPENFEEALQDPEKKKQMEEEISDHETKMKLGRNVIYRKERKY